MPLTIESSVQIVNQLSVSMEVGLAVIDKTVTVEQLTVAPSTATVEYYPGSGHYFDKVTANAVTNEIDSNIASENIRSGVSILGVEGSPTVVDTANATATANDILLGKNAYANGEEIVGEIESYSVSAPIMPTTADQTLPTANKYVETDIVVKGDSKLLPDNIKGNTTIFGVEGSPTVVNTANATAIASDIQSGKTAYVNGVKVTGTFAGGGETLPTLRTVSISRSEHTLTISNPSTNGNFVSGYKIYSNGTLVAMQTTTTFDLDTLDVGVHSITVRAYGTNFNDSNASSAVSYSIYSISNVLIDITNSNTATKIGMTQAYTGTLSAVTGKYLPDSITVTMGGSPATYTYSNTTGAISITSVTGDVVITATAETQAKLDAPIIDLTGAILSWTTVANATAYSIRSNGTEVATSTGTSIDLSTILTDDGTYVMTVVATASGYRDSNASNTVSYVISPSGTLADSTWGQIAAAAEAGTAGSIWAVGDEKDVTLTTGETITLRILGFNHDTKTAGGTAGITFGMKNLLAATYYINSSGTNVGGWGSSYMRNTTMATLYALLPAEVQTVIKPVNKLTSAGNTSSTINTTSDSLFLLSEIEVFGVVDRSFAGEGSQYAWFAAHNTAMERIKYLSNGTGSARNWWLRSPRSTNSTSFCIVTSSNGSVSSSSASSTYGVALGFCV